MSFPGETWVPVPLTCTDDIDPSVDQDEVAAVASELLFVLSGRQFGVRVQTVRPRVTSPTCVCRGCHPGGGSRFPESSGCGCSTTTIAELAGPIATVERVTLSGVDLPADAYTWSGGRIIRTDGGTFPCCQPPEANPPLLEVAYSWGRSIPESGILAARELACQLAFAAAPSTAGKCKLPARVQTISRQGVTMALLDPQSFLDEGRTGLYLVDLFLSAFNPGKNRRRARVFSPDLPNTTIS